MFLEKGRFVLSTCKNTQLGINMPIQSGNKDYVPKPLNLDLRIILWFFPAEAYWDWVERLMNPKASSFWHCAWTKLWGVVVATFVCFACHTYCRTCVLHAYGWIAIVHGTDLILECYFTKSQAWILTNDTFSRSLRHSMQEVSLESVYENSSQNKCFLVVHRMYVFVESNLCCKTPSLGMYGVSRTPRKQKPET